MRGGSRKVPAMIDKALKCDFDRDGFVIVRQAIPVAALAALMDDFRSVFELQFARHSIAGRGTENFDRALADLFDRSMDSYLGAARLIQYLPALHGLGVSGTVLGLLGKLGIARPVISTRPVIHIVSDTLVVPGGYHRTPAHQDWRSVQGSVDAVTAWLPMVPVAPGENTLEFIPGSHRRGLLSAVPHPFGNAVAPDQVAEADFVPIEAEPGDIALFSMLTVHRTGHAGRKSEGVRWAISFRYNNLDEPTFAERNFPNPYIYKPRDDLLTEGVPTSDDIAKVFGKE